ncbi:MAG: hypothetical protein ACOYES_13045 [Bacillota bacterium]
MAKILADHCDPCGRSVAVEFSCGDCSKKALNAKVKDICAGLLILTPFDSRGIDIKVFCGGALVERETAQAVIIPLERVCAVEVGAREVDGCPPCGGPPATGPVSTGPFFVRAGQKNAINVKVQNTSSTSINADVRLLGLDCPVTNPLQTKTLTGIPGGCCARDAVLTADAGNFEVVVCPDPADAPIRVFVSVHSGNAATSAIEYVIRAEEMLAPACGLC